MVCHKSCKYVFVLVDYDMNVLKQLQQRIDLAAIQELYEILQEIKDIPLFQETGTEQSKIQVFSALVGTNVFYGYLYPCLETLELEQVSLQK